MWNFKKFGPVSQEEMLFKEKGNGRTDNGRRLITIPHIQPLAQVS